MQGKDCRRDYGILPSERVFSDLIELHCVAGEMWEGEFSDLAKVIELGSWQRGED